MNIFNVQNVRKQGYNVANCDVFTLYCVKSELINLFLPDTGDEKVDFCSVTTDLTHCTTKYMFCSTTDT